MVVFMGASVTRLPPLRKILSAQRVGAGANRGWLLGLECGHSVRIEGSDRGGSSKRCHTCVVEEKRAERREKLMVLEAKVREVLGVYGPLAASTDGWRTVTISVDALLGAANGNEE